MLSRITFLTAALAIAISAPADAHHRYRAAPSPIGMIDVAAIPPYPTGSAKYAPRAPRQEVRRGRGGIQTAPRAVWFASASPEPSLGQRTFAGYAELPPERPVSGPGLVTMDVAGGHKITVSPSFGAQVAPLIAELDANGYRFTRIKCAASRGQGHHVRRSNHWTGDACDFFGPRMPPAEMVREHGLRSGRDFADSMHVDDAKNVGGVAFWNTVRQRRHRAVRYAHR